MALTYFQTEPPDFRGGWKPAVIKHTNRGATYETPTSLCTPTPIEDIVRSACLQKASHIYPAGAFL